MRKFIVPSMVLLGTLASATPAAQAVVGVVARQAWKWFFQSTGKVARETTEAGVKRTASESATPILREGAEAMSREAGRSAAWAASREGAELVARHGNDVVVPVLDDLGEEGATALAQLSPEAGRQLADVSAELAHSPYRHEWLQLIGEFGDQCVTYLWERKGSIAVAVSATAVVLSPDTFLRTGGEVLASTIESTGTHLVEPLIEESALHVAAPISHELAPFVPWMLVAGLIGGAAYWAWRRWRSSPAE